MKRRLWSSKQKLKHVLEDFLDKLRSLDSVIRTKSPRPPITVGRIDFFATVTRALKPRISPKRKNDWLMRSSV